MLSAKNLLVFCLLLWYKVLDADMFTAYSSSTESSVHFSTIAKDSIEVTIKSKIDGFDVEHEIVKVVVMCIRVSNRKRATQILSWHTLSGSMDERRGLNYYLTKFISGTTTLSTQEFTDFKGW